MAGGQGGIGTVATAANRPLSLPELLPLPPFHLALLEQRQEAGEVKRARVNYTWRAEGGEMICWIFIIWIRRERMAGAASCA
jgi:hypothetical protein